MIDTSRQAFIKELRAEWEVMEASELERLATLCNGAADLLEAEVQWQSRYEQREEEAHKLSEQIIKIQTQQVVPKEILLAISRAGLTLLKTQHGYELRKLGPAIAHTQEVQYGGDAINTPYKLNPAKRA